MAAPFAQLIARLAGGRVMRRADRLEHTRRFDGAAGGRRATGIGTFGSTQSETALAGPRLRSRARHLAANNPWLGQAVANWVASLAGSGIRPTPQHPDPAVRAAAVAAWNAWGSRADADGRTSFDGLQHDIARALVVDGEAFLMWRGDTLQHVPAELIDETQTRELGDGRCVVQGVEFDADGRRVAYWILPVRPDGFMTAMAPIRIDADEVLHIFKPLGAGQVRGVSWLAPIILAAADFDQLTDALLISAKVAAMHSGFITDLNSTSGDPFDEDALAGGLEPGTLKRLPAGLDIKFSSPEQTKEVSAFLRLQLQQLAAGLGLPTHMLSGDLSDANYSSLRAGLLPFRQRVEQIQYGTLVPQLLDPAWRRVMALAVLDGTLDVEPEVEWLMPRPMQVDPLKDTQATIAELEAGLTSRRKAIAERGWDLEQLDREIAEDERKTTATPVEASDD